MMELSWATSPGSLNTAREGLGGQAGIQTAALAFGGSTTEDRQET
jgi:hypothetical protein